MKTLSGKFGVWAVIGFTAVLTGCAQPPKFLADYYNSKDPCQSQNNGGVYPSFCGASSGRTTIYNQQNKPIGYVKTPKAF